MLKKPLYHELFKKSFDVPLRVTYWDGTSEKFGDSAPIAHITLKEPIPMADIVAHASLTLGEAYMNGILTVDGDLQALLASAYRSQQSFLKGSQFKRFLPKNRHTISASQKDIQSHYDIGNDFYRLWLDETMTYSCAYFQKATDSLEDAQHQKVHHILNKLAIQPGETLLDIGCGWGTLMITAAKEYGAKATGITLSEEQYQFVTNRIAAEGLADCVRVELVDYRKVTGRYQHVTSVGMFEHVGKENLATYFKQVSKLLAPDGTALIHGITGQTEGIGVDPWINKYIFPGGYVPSLVENLQHIMSANLQVADVEPLRRHYQRTLELWYHNFSQITDTVTEHYGERFYRMWDLYLQACAAAFQAGNIDVVQYLITNGPSGDRLPWTRRYIYDQE